MNVASIAHDFSRAVVLRQLLRTLHKPFPIPRAVGIRNPLCIEMVFVEIQNKRGKIVRYPIEAILDGTGLHEVRKECIEVEARVSLDERGEILKQFLMHERSYVLVVKMHNVWEISSRCLNK